MTDTAAGSYLQRKRKRKETVALEAHRRWPVINNLIEIRYQPVTVVHHRHGGSEDNF